MRPVQIVLPILVGFVLGFTTFLLISFDDKCQIPVELQNQIKILQKEDKLFDNQLADELLHEVKILCLIMTCPENHRTKAIHVKNTWGRKCNKLLFITSQDDPELETIVLKVDESRMALRNKTRESFLIMQRDYIKDYDWFLKADDDAYVVMENLRYMLYQYRAKTALLFGHRFAVNITELEEGYMAGATYILSKKAVTKFARNILRAPKTDSFFYSGMGEDLRMGRMLRHDAIFVDCRDELKQKRFFPLSITNHFRKTFISKDPARYWYSTNLYYNVTAGSLSCCSDVPISFHYIGNQTMLFLEFLTYHVNPFGVLKNITENLPKKLKLDEIIAASDVKSLAENFMNHTDFHNLDSSEVY